MLSSKSINLSSDLVQKLVPVTRMLIKSAPSLRVCSAGHRAQNRRFIGERYRLSTAQKDLYVGSSTDCDILSNLSSFASVVQNLVCIQHVGIYGHQTENIQNNDQANSHVWL
jgi:hypothetical protein